MVHEISIGALLKKFNERPDRQTAKVNVRIALPYIRNSILDVLNKAREIGTNK